MRLRQDDPEADWTVAGVHDVGAGVFRIPLPLPQDGLRAVNVYAVRDGDGLVTLRREFGTRIALGRGEAGTLRVAQDPDADQWAPMLARLHRGGADDLGRELRKTPAKHRIADWADPDDWLDAPQEIAFEAGTWQVHPTPGHTRGHVVFVDAARDVMFAGDHVLPQITPSIGFEQEVAELPLRDYLDSLKLVRGLPDRRLLPAHGPVTPSVHARVDELIEHHHTRLAQIDETVDAGAATAEESARRLLWTRRGRTFNELDLLSRCLAVTETMAHLDVLVLAGRLSRSEVDGVALYTRT